MATGRITKRAVDAAKAAEADSFLWDSALRGFGLKVTPKGRKIYLVQYRVGGRHGRTRRVTIGEHGSPWTPDAARKEAKRILGEVDAGRDPAAEKAKAKADKALAVVLEQFMAEHVRAKLKPRSRAEYERLAKLYIAPRLGRRPVGEIARSDVAALHYALRATPCQANRVLAVLSKFFAWAEKRGLSEGNPCRHVEKYRERRRERFLSEAELARLGEALAQAERNGSCSPWTVGAIRLLLFTGARLNEILSLRWEHVDLERACLRLPDSKTGAKTIPLNAPALDVLGRLPRVEGNPHVVVGERPGRHLVNLEKPWRRIRAAAGLSDVRLHDLRHSFASVAAGSGQSLVVIGKMLGHSQPQTTARYAHLADDPVRAASEAVARRIAAALDGGKEGGGGDVVPLARNR
jgi:integrase